MTSVPHLTAERLAIPHGFFTRVGGVSEGPYASLNGSSGGGDDPACVAENRARVAATLGLQAEALVGLTQMHGAAVVTVEQTWPRGAGPAADAMVTSRRGVGLVIITADCAPVLLTDTRAGVIGAAHAGWRGAVAGVLEATVAAMRALGAEVVTASVGPCIGPASYQVGADLRGAVLANDGAAARFFSTDAAAGRWRFDLARYCAARLASVGVDADDHGHDTCADETRFFSHRRRILAGGGPIGHQMSAIRL